MDAPDLYGLPLDRFIPERAAVAKALRSQGRRDDATRIAALRKPSLAAWAVNQLVRTHGRAVAALFKAGDALAQAQSELIAGRAGAADLRAAAERERAAVDGLVQTARGLLSSEGRELSPATLDRVAETLRAAALDDDARALVRDGCLDRELRQVGLGAGGVARSAPGSKKPRSGQAGSAPRGDDERRARAERAARERAEEFQAIRKTEADARRVAKRTAHELAVVQQRRDRAAASLRDAEDALAAARERAQEAARAHRRASTAASSLETMGP